MIETSTYAAIHDVVKTYVEGMCQAGPAKLRNAMHEDMRCIGHIDSGLEWDRRDEFIATVVDAVERPDNSPWYEVRSISVAGDIAAVLIEDVWLGDHYDDMLTLLFHEGRWVIVSKVFFCSTSG